MEFTDPLNLQPKVRPLFRRAADLVRKFPPPGVGQETIGEIANSLEAPWGARIEGRIRQVMGAGLSADDATRVIREVKELGLKPYEAPEPLPPIDLDEVSLVCWMAVVRESLR